MFQIEAYELAGKILVVFDLRDVCPRFHLLKQPDCYIYTSQVRTSWQLEPAVPVTAVVYSGASVGGVCEHVRFVDGRQRGNGARR